MNRSTRVRGRSLTSSLRRGCLVAAACSTALACTSAPTMDESLAQPVVGQPDLVITSARLAPEPTVAGEPVELAAVVTNVGTASAATSRLQACEDVDGTFCTPQVSVPALAAGARAVVRVTIPGTATRGRAAERPRTFVARVDVGARVAESREDNNARTLDPAFLVEPRAAVTAAAVEEDERAEWLRGVVTSVRRVSYGANGAPTFQRTGPRDKPERGPEALTTEVHPVVRQQAQSAGANGQLDVIVHFASPDVPFPRLPDLNPREGRFSVNNGRVLAQRAAAFAAVRRDRQSALAPLMSLVTQNGGRVSDLFVLGWAFRATIAVGLLDVLARDARVRTIEPVRGGERAPGDDVLDARAIVGTDAFYNIGSTGAGWTLGLLDTGVRETHTLLSGPDRVGLFRDCAHGDSYCLDVGNAGYDPSDNCSHGTSSASIMVGNSNLGATYRGMTNGEVDSFDVYDNCFLDSAAVLNGFDRALFWGDKVIVAEIQSSQSHTGSIADAADDAFDAGSLVIAANGNNGPASGTVNSPANAHNAVAIGAYDVVSRADYANQSRGPTPDGRIKPDVRFPNNTETGTATSNTSTGVFTGTSGATPYGGGTALILVDESQNLGWSTDPGRIYSMLIAFGDRQDPFGNIAGAGDVFVGRTNDLWVRGTRSITHNDVDTVDIPVNANDTCIEAGIWWSEGVTWHNDIDLYLDDPAGVQRASSIETDSVFERIRISGPFVPGTWRLRIEGYSVKAAASPETVYFFTRVCH